MDLFCPLDFPQSFLSRPINNLPRRSYLPLLPYNPQHPPLRPYRPTLPIQDYANATMDVPTRRVDGHDPEGLEYAEVVSSQVWG